MEVLLAHTDSIVCALAYCVPKKYLKKANIFFYKRDIMQLSRADAKILLKRLILLPLKT